MSIGIWQILIIALVLVLLFGRGKISDLMGDVAKGITSFKKGLKEGGEDESDEERKAIADKREVKSESSESKASAVKSKDTAHG